MRRLAGAALALGLLAPPALAQSAGETLALDRLFDQLRYAPDAESARAIDRQIWAHWTTPDDPVLAVRMAEALSARTAMQLVDALALLDALLADYPDYAEAWNQRATVHFLLGDLDASLADIDKVLLHEPRHFGALSGQAQIYRRQGKQALALKAISTALDLHPFLEERSMFPRLFEGMTRL